MLVVCHILFAALFSVVFILNDDRVPFVCLVCVNLSCQMSFFLHQNGGEITAIIEFAIAMIEFAPSSFMERCFTTK